MATAILGATPFNPLDHSLSQGAGQLPVGRHLVNIVGSDIKEARSGNGGYLELSLQVVQGEAKGSRGAVRLNLWHENAITARIASQHLAIISHCVGVLNQFTDVGVLHNKPFYVDVSLSDPTNEKGYTEVKHYYDTNGNEPGATPSQQQPQAKAPVKMQAVGDAHIPNPVGFQQQQQAPAPQVRFDQQAGVGQQIPGANQNGFGQQQQQAAPAFGGAPQNGFGQAPQQVGFGQQEPAGNYPWNIPAGTVKA